MMRGSLRVIEKLYHYDLLIVYIGGGFTLHLILLHPIIMDIVTGVRVHFVVQRVNSLSFILQLYIFMYYYSTDERNNEYAKQIHSTHFY